MKISDEEVKAAIAAWNSPAENVEDSIRAALSAAYTVRKARKAAKRAKANQKQTIYSVSLGEIDFNALRRQWSLNPATAAETTKPEQPEHRFKVGDRVVHAVFGAGAIKEITNLIQWPYFVAFDGSIGTFCTANELSPEPAKPEWNGKFEVGKSYRMRGGGKAMVCYNNGPLSSDNGTVKYPLVGSGAGVGGLMWTDDGRYNVDNESQFDLIIPWED